MTLSTPYHPHPHCLTYQSCNNTIITIICLTPVLLYCCVLSVTLSNVIKISLVLFYM